MGSVRHVVVVGLALAGSIVGLASGRARPGVAMPGPAVDGPAEDRGELNASCVRCHAEAGRQWSASLHRHAWDDADFQVAADRERRAFCRGCHAPEADPAAAPDPSAARMGVACVTCHVPRHAELPEGAVLSGLGTTAGKAPHAIVRAAAFDGSEACASCHEFDSPHTKGLAMQSTVSEHARSSWSRRSCVDCHMPRSEDGRRAHGFAASRDPEMIAAALSVRAARDADGEVVLSLAPADVGHAFPTGDLFRRLRVQTGHLEGERFEVHDERLLGRWFRDRLAHGLTPQRVQVRDDRPGGDQDRVEVRLSAPIGAPGPVAWRVVYERVDQPIGRDEPQVFGAIVAAQGELPFQEERR